ncbi:lymphocyte cytosolic protein 2 [Aplochiton taeniatus]
MDLNAELIVEVNCKYASTFFFYLFYTVCFLSCSLRLNDPPAPPKRLENNAGYGWPEDEFDEEDGDTYEAPPCERPVVKVPSREREENIYLDERTPNSVIPKRPAAPPRRPAKMTPKQDKEWFAGDCNRKTAEDLLLRINKDGAFLIRHSSAQNTRQPYTLAVLYRAKVYNIPIRFLDETQGYALGKEGKKSEELFSSLQKIISHHKNNQLLLIDSKSQAKHTTYLTHPARP